MTNSDDFILTMKDISKTFPGVSALENVDFSLKRGEIHALVGENGAGKSTLIKVLTGVETPDSGTIELDGNLVQVRSPQHSQAIGISTVYQEINLCTNISIAENIMLGHRASSFRRYSLEKAVCLRHAGLEKAGCRCGCNPIPGKFFGCHPANGGNRPLA